MSLKVFRGFGYTAAYRLNSSQTVESSTETWFHQDSILKGNINKQTVTSKEGHTMRVENLWEAYSLGSGAYHARLNRTTLTNTDYGSGPYSYYTEYGYDSYLNISHEHKVGSTPEEEVHTYLAYTNLIPYIVSKPTDVSVTDSSGNIVSRKWMDYDAATGNLLTEEVCRSGTPVSGCVNRNPAQNVVTAYTYYLEGNPHTVTDPLGGVTALTYDATKTHVYEKTNPLGHRTTTEYDAGIGKATRLVLPHLQGSPKGKERKSNRPRQNPKKRNLRNNNRSTLSNEGGGSQKLGLPTRNCSSVSPFFSPFSRRRTPAGRA